jgi:acyl-CoA thioesterase II
VNPLLADLIKVLGLERLEINLFRGESRDVGSPQVYGGQVLGQALMAAAATVDGRRVHSLHAYFLRRGDFRHPIIYDVDRSRDGTSFTSRRVIAIQHGHQIFHMSASFQVDEHGFEHQLPMPAVPGPDELEDDEALGLRSVRHSAGPGHDLTPMQRPFQFRRVPPESSPIGSSGVPLNCQWFRAIEPVPCEETVHAALLAYISDYHLLTAALFRHGWEPGTPSESGVMLASLDHAMWFHRPARVDEWLLYATDSPSASGARGLALGSIFDTRGQLVATTAQEGLMRELRKS